MVTGGAGFIGSHVVDALLARDDRVIVIDDLSSGDRRNLASHASDSRLRFVEADVAECLLAPLLEVPVIDAVVHLAAQVSVARSVERPLADLRTNVRGTVQVLELARRRGIPRVVFASSAAVYGDATTVPTPEDAPTRPLSPYGVDKRSAELWLDAYAAEHGVATTALRFFNVYGPRQDPTSGYSGVISIFLDRALRGAPLTIFGDGGQTRDFVYVGDVARAVLAAVDHGGATEPINVGTGTPVSVRELAEEVLRVTASARSIEQAPPRAGDIRHSCAQATRLHDVLGLRAETPFARGLEETARWYAREAGV